MKIISLAVASLASSLVFGQVHVVPTSATWSNVTHSTPEYGPIHTFSAGTQGGVSTASGYTNRTSARGGGPFNWSKSDHLSGKLTFNVKWFGSNPGTGQSVLLKVWRTVNISGYIAGYPIPNQAKWIRTQFSGAFWDVSCSWMLNASIGASMSTGYSHPDNLVQKALIDMPATASFQSTPQPDGSYLGTIEFWPYWDHVTQALVEGDIHTLHQNTNVAYNLELFKVGGIVVDGFSGAGGNNGGSGPGGNDGGAGGNLPPRGGGDLLTTLLAAGSSKPVLG